MRSDIRGRGMLDALAMLPLAVPGLVMAFGYLAISSQFSNADWVKESPFWQAVFDVRINPTLFLVIAYAVRRLPYMVRSAVAGLQQTSVTFEEAAANLGAGPFTTLRRITLPLILANLIAGALLAFRVQHAGGLGQPDARPAAWTSIRSRKQSTSCSN